MASSPSSSIAKELLDDSDSSPSALDESTGSSPLVEENFHVMKGMRVEYKGTPATVRYLGPLHNAEGDWVGLELDKPSIFLFLFWVSLQCK